MTREAAPDICCLQVQESEIKTMRRMCLSPALEVALRWLAATPRAQHTAGKGPVSPATPRESHQGVRAAGDGPVSSCTWPGPRDSSARIVAGERVTGRVSSGPCHCCPPGLSAFSHLGERFKSIGPITDRSALALWTIKVFTKGRENGQGFKKINGGHFPAYTTLSSE